MTINDLLNDNFACRDPRAGRWISEARKHLAKCRQAQREAFEKAAHLASEYTGPGTQNVHPDIPFESMGQNAQHISHSTAQGIAGAIRALMDEESTGNG